MFLLQLWKPLTKQQYETYKKMKLFDYPAVLKTTLTYMYLSPLQS